MFYQSFLEGSPTNKEIQMENYQNLNSTVTIQGKTVAVQKFNRTAKYNEDLKGESEVDQERYQRKTRLRKGIHTRNFLKTKVFDRDDFISNQVKTYLDYKKMGILLKPIKLGCKQPPLFTDSQLESMSDEEILGFIKSRPVNLAIMTGSKSGVIAVDADSEEAMNWMVKNLPETPLVTITPRGEHRLYRSNDEDVGSTIKFTCPDSKKIIDLDTRGRNAYVMAPGSLHPASHLLDKAEYSKMSDEEKLSHAIKAGIYYRSKSDLGEFSIDLLPEFKKEWFKKDRNEEEESLISPMFSRQVDDRLHRRVEMYLKGSKPAVEGSGGDVQTFKVVSDLVRGFTLSKEDTLVFFNEYYNPKCEPSWSKEDILKKIDNASKYGDLEIGYLLKENPSEQNFTKKPMFFSVGEFLKQKAVKVPWLISGLLPAQGTSILFAKPKTGKTTLALQAAVDVAQGTKFLSRDVAQGSVLMLLLEDNLQMTRDKFSTYSDEAKAKIYLYSGNYLVDPFHELESMIKELRPTFIIIDTLQKFLNITDANDYSLVYSKMSILNNLSRTYSCHILFLHHANKSSSGSGFDSIMGSTAFRGAVDVSIFMTEEGGHRFIVSEGRYGTPIAKKQISFDVKTGAVNLGLMDEEDLVNENAASKILNFLKKNNAEIKYSDLQEMIGLRKSNFLNAFKMLVEKNEIITTTRGKGVKYVSLVPH